METLGNSQVLAAGLADWRKLAQSLHGRFLAPDVATAVDGRWVTDVDLALATRISGTARELGLTPEPAGVTQVELGLDTADEDAVAPFWAALLTGDPGNRVHDSVLDPSDRVPALWFQGTGPREAPRQT